MSMIGSFKSKALASLWYRQSAAKLDSRLAHRITVRLARLNKAISPDELNVPGFDFHKLSGDRIGFYSIHVNGPWCLTFEWEDQEAMNIDLENYH